MQNPLRRLFANPLNESPVPQVSTISKVDEAKALLDLLKTLERDLAKQGISLKFEENVGKGVYEHNIQNIYIIAKIS